MLLVLKLFLLVLIENFLKFFILRIEEKCAVIIHSAVIIILYERGKKYLKWEVLGPGYYTDSLFLANILPYLNLSFSFVRNS